MSDIKMNEIGPTRVSTISSAQKNSASVTSSASAKVEKLEPQAKPQQAQDTKAVSKAEVENAVTKLNDFVQTVQRNLQFNLDDLSGKTIITVVDKETSEVVRQIPDDVAVRLAQDLQQSEPLSLFNAKV
jgi:flagellar protein FlaG